MPGVVISTRSPILYSCGILFEFSRLFELFMLFCLFNRIRVQSATNCTGKNISRPKTTGSCAGDACRVVWYVLLIAKAAAVRNSSHGFVSSSSRSSSSKFRKALPNTCWCLRFITRHYSGDYIRWKVSFPGYNFFLFLFFI